MDISNSLKAGYHMLYIETLEALRAIASIKTAPWKSYCWDCLRGIADRDTGKIVEDLSDPLGAAKWLGSQNDTVLMVQNFHHLSLFLLVLLYLLLHCDPRGCEK